MKVFKYILIALIPLALFWGYKSYESYQEEQAKKEVICANEEFARKTYGRTERNPYYKCDFHEE
ncbi:hypothetical protein AAEX37_01762 [Oligella sp. MSHR50489EDL]|uniref:hypothetical protein n=1 Tax=Oligella sp. MSHR50489EDL TaxID=3139409 RepID=UPI003D8198BE